MPVSVRMVVMHIFSVLLSYDIANSSYKYMHTAGPNEQLHASIQRLMPGIDQSLVYEMRVLQDCPRHAEFHQEMLNVFKLDALYYEYFDAHVKLARMTTDLMVGMINVNSVDDDAMLGFMDSNMDNSENEWKQRYDAINILWQAKNNLLDDLHKNQNRSV